MVNIKSDAVYFGFLETQFISVFLNQIIKKDSKKDEDGRGGGSDFSKTEIIFISLPLLSGTTLGF
jgi:hypothetical protein